MSAAGTAAPTFRCCLLLLWLSPILTCRRPSAGGSQPITVVYAGATRPDIGSLARDLESTLTNVAVSLLSTIAAAPALCALLCNCADDICRVVPLYLL